MEPTLQLPSETAVPAVPQEGEDLLEVLTKDLNRLKAQKARPTGGVEGTTLLNLCFRHDEQYVNYRSKGLSLEPQDANKLYLTFNLIEPRCKKLEGRLAAFNAPFKARPNKKDPQAIEDAEIVDRMILALDEKLDEPSKMRERLYWLLTGGTVFEYVPWVPNATIEPMPVFAGTELLFQNTQTGEQAPQSFVESSPAPEQWVPVEEVQITGEVGSEILSPFNVFIDASTKSVAELQPGQWVHIAQIKTIEWIKENYGVDIEPHNEISLISSRINVNEGESAGGVYLKDLLPIVQGCTDQNDPPMVVHVSSYQCATASNPKGHYVCWVPDRQILHDDVNPYEEVPLVDIHFGPTTSSFWSKAYVTPLISPQRFINKRMSQLGEQANAAIYSNLLLGAGLTEADIPADYPGMVKNGLAENGQPNVGRIPPPEIPQWFLESINLAVKMFNDAAGATDLMEDTKFPGQLRGPMAVPMLQEILDTQWGPLFTHLGERLARIKQMRLNRVKQFYPPVRTMHYTDRTQKDEVMEFHTEDILRAGTNFNITVERGSILPELRSLRESRVAERLSGPLAILYMDERTGRLDKSKIAADLQFGDTGREGRESVYRKLALEIIDMLWRGQQVPPVQPFYDHAAMLDELEQAMATTEFLRASQPIQALFADRWQQHATFMQQEAAAQQAGMQNQMIHSAVAQATQQAAAKAAAEAVEQAMAQVSAQKAQPTGTYVNQAEQEAFGASKPAQPEQKKPAPKSRKVTIEEKG